MRILYFIAIIPLCWSCTKLTSESCALINRQKICKCGRAEAGVICCHIEKVYSLKESLACTDIQRNEVKHLYLYNTSIPSFDADWDIWSNLETLTVTHSKLTNITGRFKGNLRCANFSSNANLSGIETKAFTDLANLTMLDLSKNNLTNLPAIDVGKKNFTLDISANKNLQCTNLKNFLESNLKTNLSFLNRNTTICFLSLNLAKLFSADYMPLSELEVFINPERDCPKGVGYRCDCGVYRMAYVQGNKYTIQVNCSGLHLTELPEILPRNTVYLDVSNNNISSLEPFSKNPFYYNINIFIADNNKINSIVALEGSNFIDNFAILSLRNNELKTIPIYILSHSFDRNYNSRFIKLGGNKLYCDCNTVQGLKLWLQANKEHVPDYEDIMCEKDFESVVYLDQNKLCVYQKDWTELVYYIISGEVMLLLLLVSKVFYDYWIFKTSGYLPWPASNMPKLPCDWVFES